MLRSRGSGLLSVDQTTQLLNRIRVVAKKAARENLLKIEDADLIVWIRQEVSLALDFDVQLTTSSIVRDRYDELLATKVGRI
jgi:hypothetical protein